MAERKQAIASIAALSEGHPVRWFAMRGAGLTAFDPRAPEELSARGASTDLATMFSSLRNLRDTEPHALVLVTEWNEFRALDLDRVKRLLKTPTIVDLRNIYRPEQMRAAGFNYSSIGRP